jgi:Tfp pilus assembly protein PilV
MTLIEVMIATLIAVVLGAGVWTLLRSTYDSQYLILNQNQANTKSRTALDAMLETLRGASALTSAASNDVTFTHPSGTIRFWHGGGKLLKTVGGVPSGGATVSDGISNMYIVYSTYSGGSWTSSSNPATPSAVGLVEVSVTSTVNGYSRTMKGSVEIRQKRA